MKRFHNCIFRRAILVDVVASSVCWIPEIGSPKQQPTIQGGKVRQLWGPYDDTLAFG